MTLEYNGQPVSEDYYEGMIGSFEALAVILRDMVNTCKLASDEETTKATQQLSNGFEASFHQHLGRKSAYEEMAEASGTICAEVDKGIDQLKGVLHQYRVEVAHQATKGQGRVQ